TKNGGKVIQEKTEIGNDFGFFALFEDNSGNILGLWSQK
ncbi:MAG: VOC family protein, partial [Candidatus Heimdallarchaeota archaeon]|nr:VOC family protein [Candidatus Heimdallarchaeota archaeon]